LRKLTGLFARDRRKGIAYASTGPNMSAFSNLAQHMIELLNVVCGRFPRAGEKVRRSSVQVPAQPSVEQVIPASRPWDAKGPGRIRGVKDLFGEKLSATLADEILTPGEVQLKALIVAGGNPATSLPDQRKAARALGALDLLVTIDPWMSATAQLADYIFAPTMQYEQIGLSLDIPGMNFWPGSWAQYTPRMVPAPAGSDLVDDLAAELAQFWATMEAPVAAPDDGAGHRFLMVTRRLRDVFNSTGITLPVVRKRTPYNPAWFNGADCSPSAPMAQIWGCDLRRIWVSS
jgi:anaerobic selenocysteine-containing dehydrogenase